MVGFGSGVIISEDGYVVTNDHVIEFADRFEVTLYDNKTYNADVVGRDPDADLAVLKIDSEESFFFISLLPIPITSKSGNGFSPWAIRLIWLPQSLPGSSVPKEEVIS